MDVITNMVNKAFAFMKGKDYKIQRTELIGGMNYISLFRSHLLEQLKSHDDISFLFIVYGYESFILLLESWLHS